MRGIIFDILRFAIHDGPGIRCTAFLKGCPLHCIWCHNPEGISSEPEIAYLPSRCIHCSECVRSCSYGAINLHEGSITIDRKRCVRCLCCAQICPSNAMLHKDREITTEELIEEFAKDEVFFKHSNGGITLSGGEPLYQPDFVAEILKLSRNRGFHTAVETCLYSSCHVLDKLISLPDLWIVDLKVMNEQLHKKLTGQSNSLILRNYEKLVEEKYPLLTRLPIIPGYTDSEENLLSLGHYIAKLNPDATVELMFYNPLSETKYKNYRMDYSLSELKSYISVQKKSYIELLSRTGVDIINTTML